MASVECGSRWGVDLESGPKVVRCWMSPIEPQQLRLWSLLLLIPDSLQWLPEAFCARSVAQQVPSELGLDAPELQPSGNRKDHPGHKHPEGVVHHAASFLDAKHFLVCWCCLNVHWFPFPSLPFHPVVLAIARWHCLDPISRTLNNQFSSTWIDASSLQVASMGRSSGADPCN